MTAHAAAQQVTKAVPGLDIVFRNGFDAKGRDFATDKVFAAFTFRTENQVDYGSPEQPYLVPDGLAWAPVSDESSVHLDQLLQTVDDYDRTFSINAEVEGSYGAFTAAAKSSYFQHARTLTWTERAYAMNFLVVRTYTARRLGHPQDPALQQSLDPAFREAAVALPASATTASAHTAYADFFHRYGTHYLAAADFGGYVLMTSSVDKKSVTTENETKILGSISVGFDGAVAKGSLSVEVANDEVHKNQVVHTEIIGDLYRLGGELSDDKTKWETSLYAAPRPLIGLPPNARATAELAPLSDLAPDEDRRRTMDRELSAYLGIQPPALLGGTSRRRRDLRCGEVHAVTADSVVVAVISVLNGPRGSIEVRSETADEPRRVLGAASAHHYLEDNSDNWVRQSSTTAAVREGDHLVVTPTFSTGEPAVSVRSLQLGATGQDDVGVTFTVQPGNPATAATDGLLVCALNCAIDGDCGGVSASIDEAVVAGCSGHWYSQHGRWIPRASFCVPVRKGERYAVTPAPISGTPRVEASFIPLVGGIGFGQRRDRDADQPSLFTAEEDGLLVGWSHAHAGTRGDVTVYADVDADKVRQRSAPVVAAMSTHANHTYDRWGVYIDDASLCVPIMKGESYLAVRNDTWGKPRVRLSWVPLVRNSPAR